MIVSGLGQGLRQACLHCEHVPLTQRGGDVHLQRADILAGRLHIYRGLLDGKKG